FTRIIEWFYHVLLCGEYSIVRAFFPKIEISGNKSLVIPCYLQNLLQQQLGAFFHGFFSFMIEMGNEQINFLTVGLNVECPPGNRSSQIGIPTYTLDIRCF